MALDQLPDALDALKSLVADQAARNAQLQAAHQAVVQHNEHLQAKVLSLQEQLNLALARRFAARSEKLSPDQIRLFDEAELEADTPGAEEDETVTVPAHTRRKTGRKPLPDHLPRVEVVHALSEAERVCPHDGQLLAEIGEVVSEQLDIIPAKIQVIRHIRKQYACRCGQCIKTAPTPAQPIPKSLASPGLLAHITVSKYQDALPLYRQEAILKRIGVELPRATLAKRSRRRASRKNAARRIANAAENAIRPFVLGRKNWLFSDSVRGVQASANLYSLIETAKANGLEPYEYLRRVFTELPRADSLEAIEALLP